VPPLERSPVGGGSVALPTPKSCSSSVAISATAATAATAAAAPPLPPAAVEGDPQEEASVGAEPPPPAFASSSPLEALDLEEAAAAKPPPPPPPPPPPSGAASSAQSPRELDLRALTFEAWLSRIDCTGSLSAYLPVLEENYDTVAQIVKTYASSDRAPPRINDAVVARTAALDPQFFEDMHVIQAQHQSLFGRWFERWQQNETDGEAMPCPATLELQAVGQAASATSYYAASAAATARAAAVAEEPITQSQAEQHIAEQVEVVHQHGEEQGKVLASGDSQSLQSHNGIEESCLHAECRTRGIHIMQNGGACTAPVASLSEGVDAYQHGIFDDMLVTVDLSAGKPRERSWAKRPLSCCAWCAGS